MRIAVMAVHRPQFDAQAAAGVFHRVGEAVGELGHAVTLVEPMLDEWQVDRQLPAAVEATRGSDLAVVVVATFVGADMVVKLLQAVGLPALLWAVPEPRVGQGRLQLNSLCGAIITNHALQQMALSVEVLYGDPAAPETREELASHLRAEQAVRVLRTTVLGVVGRRPAGYYPSDYDELALWSTFGVRVRTVALEEAFAQAEASADDPDTARSVQAARQLAASQAVSEDQVVRSARAEGGLRRLAAANGLTALCVECWPQYLTQYGGAVCWANSRLIDAGLLAGCEADVHGTLTMVLERALSGESPFFGDLVHLVDDDRLVFWHCGAAPLSLAGEAPRASVHPNRRVGLTLDFALKPGPVTVLRLHREAQGGYRLMAIPGTAAADPLYFSGNTVAVKPERDARQVLQGLLDAGAEHHFAVGYGVRLADVERVCRRLRLPLQVF